MDEYIAWTYLDKGILPFAGGWFEQPEYFRQACQYFNMIQEIQRLDALIPEIKEHIAKKATEIT